MVTTVQLYESKRCKGFKPGDIARTPGGDLYRFLGVAQTIPRTSQRGRFLVFEYANLIAPRGHRGDYQYLTPSQTKGLEKVGNIPERLWSVLDNYQMRKAEGMELGGKTFGTENVYTFLVKYFMDRQKAKLQKPA